MSLLFLKNGILTTIQDLGRSGFRRLGINPNGVMDDRAVRLINVLLGNNETTGVLEMHFPAPSLLFETNAIIALGGANFSPKLGEIEIENWRPFFVSEGSVLSFAHKKSGAGAYLAVQGGFKIASWLGSESTNLKAKSGGFEGKALQKGDRLFFNQTTAAKERKSRFPFKVSNSLIPHYSSFPTVRAITGAEYENLTAEGKETFLTTSFAVRNESDRMGFRLRNESLNLTEKLELVSSATNFGTIQLLPDGQLIILMADHQTTGGYPRIAHVISADLPLLAQLNANDKVYFRLVSVGEAENAILHFENELNYLRVGCKFVNASSPGSI